MPEHFESIDDIKRAYSRRIKEANGSKVAITRLREEERAETAKFHEQSAIKTPVAPEIPPAPTPVEPKRFRIGRMEVTAESLLDMRERYGSDLVNPWIAANPELGAAVLAEIARRETAEAEASKQAAAEAEAAKAEAARRAPIDAAVAKLLNEDAEAAWRLYGGGGWRGR